MKLPCLWKRMCCALKALHLADQCLLVFMFLLMAQSAHNLLFHELTMETSSGLDVIVRTTAAAIFGYFISANFQNGGREPGAAAQGLAQGSGEDAAARGLTQGSGEGASAPPEGTASKEGKQRNCLQILVVATIGLASLVLLLIAHNFFRESAGAAATISQLRDFVSGSVGFLIGHSTQTGGEP